MDHDDSGVISPANIRELLGTRANDDLVQRMMDDGDFKRNGVIDFDEFAALMKSPPPTPTPFDAAGETASEAAPPQPPPASAMSRARSISQGSGISSADSADTAPRF